MAEGIFRAGMEANEFEVSSAGVAAQPGSSASFETLSVLEEKGISLDGFRSRMVDDGMLQEADAVFCMTAGHLEMLEMMHPGFEGKFHLVCDFTEFDGQVGTDVPDPIGMGREAYDSTFRVLSVASAGVMGFLRGRA